MAPQKLSQMPLRTSARLPKPSAKKRSPSYSQQHAPRRSKKPKAHSSTSSTLLEISDEDKDKDQDQEDEDQDQEDEDQDQEEDIEDDDAEEEEKEEEARSFKFKTTWKALCGKEHRPGIRSAYYINGTLL